MGKSICGEGYSACISEGDGWFEEGILGRNTFFPITPRQAIEGSVAIMLRMLFVVDVSLPVILAERTWRRERLRLENSYFKTSS